MVTVCPSQFATRRTLFYVLVAFEPSFASAIAGRPRRPPASTHGCRIYNQRSAGACMDVQVVDNFIAGRWVPAHASEFFDVHNPAVGDVIGRTPLSTGADVDAAVQAATLAFPAWRETPVNTRAQVLYKFKARLEQHFEELARIATTEHGQ